jgi:hypothetical protein
MTYTLEPFHVGELAYETRDLGSGIEAGAGLTGYFTGELDTWGKWTFVGGDGIVRYLFTDEIVGWSPFGEAR